MSKCISGRVFSLAIIAVVAGAASCKRESLLAVAPGKYVGFVLRADLAATEQFLTQAEIRPASGGGVEIEVSATSGSSAELPARKWNLTVTVPDSKTLALKAPEIFGADRILKRRGSQGDSVSCFESEGKPATRLCYDGKELDLNADLDPQGMFTLVLDRFDPAAQPPLEEPKSYEATQLVQRAMDQSFDTRAEFERVVQAKLMARNAWLNLLPHFSFNTFFTFINFQPVNLVRAIGDLVPFLLPTRWFRASQAKQLAESELLAWQIMKADAANVVEGLVFAIRRDDEAIARTQKHRQSVESVRNEIRMREKLGIVEVGSSDGISSVLNQVDQTLVLLEQARDGEMSSLSQAAGFMNPHAVAAITGQPGMTLTDIPADADIDAAVNFGMQHALELRQIDVLIQQAASSRKQRYFNWLDPSGEAGSGLGVGFPSYLAIGSSQVRELEEKRLQLKSILMQKLNSVAVEIRGSLQSQEIARSETVLQARQLKRLLGNLKFGVSISLTELVNSLQGGLKADLDQNNAEYASYVAASKLNRAILTGPYAKIPLYRPE